MTKENQPFPDLDGREEKTKRLRRNALEILGGELGYQESSYAMQSMARRAAMLEYMMETCEMSVSEFTQANNALVGIYKSLGVK